MENFFNYITKPLNPDDVEVWFRANNIIHEKMELFSDFMHSLNQVILDTYLGETPLSNETKITLTKEDKMSHFEWCWKKTLSNFSKEGIIFQEKGEHYDYFKTFFEDIFYNQQEEKIRNSIGNFFQDLFDKEKSFTKSDLDMIITIYKLLDKNIKNLH
jgi:hypothetical protein